MKNVQSLFINHGFDFQFSFKQKTTFGKDRKKLEPSYTVGGNAK